MARQNTTRRQIVANAIQARSPVRNGGTSAPRSAAAGPRLSGNRVAPAGSRVGGAQPVKPAGVAGGTGGTAAPPANYAPTPWDSKADQKVAAARKTYLDASGNFDLSETTAKQDFGLDPGFNDYKSNPYSRAALLEQSYLTNNRGTMNSAGNQLYSGSTSNHLAANRATNGINRDALAKEYRDALGEINDARTKAKEKKDEEEREADWERNEHAEASEPDAEAAPGGGGSSGYAPTGKAAGPFKPKKPNRQQQTKQAISNSRRAR